MLDNGMATTCGAGLGCGRALAQKRAVVSRQGDRRAGFPLRMAGEGDRVKIVGLIGGAGLHDRLAGIGLAVGSRLQVLRNPMDGKLIVDCQGTRLFIGGGMAHKIAVVQEEGEER